MVVKEISYLMQWLYNNSNCVAHDLGDGDSLPLPLILLDAFLP